MLILVIGDLHIPHRAASLSKKFKKLLVPGKIQQILATGNLCDRATYDYLKTIASDVQLVKGDLDDFQLSKQPIPHTIRLQHGPLKLGLLHGHQLVPYQDEQVLLQTARQMEVDILIYGHVHQCGVKERDGLLLVNPGSATGALCTATASENTTPSFILMDVQGAHVTVYVYQEIGVEVKVEKLEYQKPGS